MTGERMAADDFASELAYLASNLEERTRVVRQMSDRRAPKAAPSQLDEFDAWRIEKLAEKLGSQRRSESYRFEGSPREFTRQYQSILTDYALYWLGRDRSGVDASEFVAIHAEWIDIYTDALATMDADPADYATACWREEAIATQSFVRVCEPFLRLLQRDLAKAFDSAEATSRTIRFSSNVVRDVVLHLLNRFELAMAWALEADINVYCSHNGLEKGTEGVAGLERYYQETFPDRRAYHRFYGKFPVLGRWLSQGTRLLRDSVQELIGRLVVDAPEISVALLESLPITRVDAFHLGRSDPHAGGRSVVIVDVTSGDGSAHSIVYKPRGIESEAAMQQLLAHLKSARVAPFATYRVLCKPDYGYTEYIPPGKNQAVDKATVHRLYQQLGAYLAVFYILGGTDLHFENILVSEGNAFICDYETILGVLPKGMDVHLASFGESVYRTGMLEWPRAVPADSEQEMRLSGYSGGESYELPFAVPRIDSRELMSLKVEYRSKVRVEQEAPNRILFEDRIVDPRDYQVEIVEGFNRVYDWFERRPEESSPIVETLFSGASIRFINWGTQAYIHLLVAARHPKCLAEPLEVDLVFNLLRYHRRQWDRQGSLLERELASLWSLDVPIFTARATGTSLIADHRDGDPLLVDLALSPVANAGERIRRLSPDNRVRQNQYIRVGLSPGEIHSPDFIAAAEDHARQVGDQLARMMRPDGVAPWRTYELTPRGTEEVDVGLDLYHGASGIGLFLAYLDAIRPDRTIREAARQAISHAMELDEPEAIGAFDGAAGLVYALAHVAQLWGNPALLNRANETARRIAGRLDGDRKIDILGGAAGVLLVALGLETVTGNGVGLDLAHRCADHLLGFAEERDGSLSWPTVTPEVAPENLSGYAHGTSGIGWSLMAMGSFTGRSDYIEAARKAFAYDSRHFDSIERDWFDLRTSVRPVDPTKRHFSNAWCNGAAGIGLSRIASWAALGKDDDELLREAYIALAATTRNFHKLGTDSLCHGRSGNGELLLRMALLRDEPALQMEANIQVQAQWRGMEQTRGWISSDRGAEVFPGLMLGISGFGLHSLRLAHPDRVPSPLLLDPPPGPGSDRGCGSFKRR